jgi:hypothetical protein
MQYSGIYVEKLGEIVITRDQCIRSLDKDFNTGHFRYEAGALKTTATFDQWLAVT